jgi:hypothetical protein
VLSLGEGLVNRLTRWITVLTLPILNRLAIHSKLIVVSHLKPKAILHS